MVSFMLLTASKRADVKVIMVTIVGLGLYYSVLNVYMSMEMLRISWTWYKTMNNTPIPSWPLNLSDLIVQEMLQHNMERSAHLQSKFLSRKNELTMTLFPTAMRFQPYVGDSYAIPVNGTKWAYLHVWKSGGSTMIIQLQTNQTSKESVQDDIDLFTFVRDPIDHFLSAYGECGYRTWFYDDPKNRTLMWNASAYDEQIQLFLNQTKYKAYNKSSYPEEWCFGKPMIDVEHAYPQINFMLDNAPKNGITTLNPKLKIIADLSEMPRAMEMILGIQYDRKRGKQRTSASNRIKSKYYPARKDLIHDSTMVEICKFLIMDYFLLDYEMPSACAQLLDNENFSYLGF